MREPISDEARNLEISAKAYREAEIQIEEGRASAQVLCFFLKWGAEYAKSCLELEKIRAETELAKAKVDAIKETSNAGALAGKALKAFSVYGGNPGITDDEIDQMLNGES